MIHKKVADVLEDNLSYLYYGLSPKHYRAAALVLITMLNSFLATWTMF